MIINPGQRPHPREQGAPFDYAAVKALAHPAESAVPHVAIGVPDLGAYDDLITMAGAA